MGGRDRHFIDDDENEDEEEEEDDLYMYPGDMTLDERAEFQVACRASKATNGTDNKNKDLREAKEKLINL